MGEEAPCEKLPEVHPPTEKKTTYVEPSGEPSKVGRWTVREGVENARTIHAVLLQNGKLLLMAGSGNDRMEFARGCFRSYIYNPDANTWKEIKTPKDVFCAGHVQLANGNVLIVGGTKAYPPAPKNPGEFPSTVYEGENTSWIFNIRTEQYEKVKYDEADPNNSNEPGPLLNGARYPSATEARRRRCHLLRRAERGRQRRHPDQLLHRRIQRRGLRRRPAGRVGGLGSPLLQQHTTGSGACIRR